MTKTLDSTFYANVQNALVNGLLAVAGVPAADHWAFENFAFQEPTGQPWVRFTFRPQPNRPASLGVTQVLIRHLGAALVDYYLPLNTGTTTADTFASAVVTALRPGQYLTSAGQLVIVRSCFASNGRQTDQWYQRSITIGWTADTLTT